MKGGAAPVLMEVDPQPSDLTLELSPHLHLLMSSHLPLPPPCTVRIWTVSLSVSPCLSASHLNPLSVSVFFAALTASLLQDKAFILTDTHLPLHLLLLLSALTPPLGPLVVKRAIYSFIDSLVCMWVGCTGG